jgi:hypothetical protein
LGESRSEQVHGPWRPSGPTSASYSILIIGWLSTLPRLKLVIFTSLRCNMLRIVPGVPMV